MRSPDPIRLVLACLALWFTACPTPTRAQNDRGIGGTGTISHSPDRGIGGTGVIGTIRGFGSIWVNGLEIFYGANAAVTIDGRAGSTSDLRVGQVVRVTATREAGVFQTTRIDIASEVVGPVQRVRSGQIEVLGQTVLTRNVPGAAQLRPGYHVAVSGLRRPDGRIVASLIERWDDGPMLVSGPVSRQADGSLRVGGLKIAGVDPRFVGQRAVLHGALRDEVFQVTSAVAESALFGSGVTTFSLEAYVEGRGNDLRLGSGWAVSARAPSAGKTTGQVVVTAATDTSGRLVVRDIEDAISAARRGKRGRLGEAAPTSASFMPSGSRPADAIGAGASTLGHATSTVGGMVKDLGTSDPGIPESGTVETGISAGELGGGSLGGTGLGAGGSAGDPVGNALGH